MCVCLCVCVCVCVCLVCVVCEEHMLLDGMPAFAGCVLARHEAPHACYYVYVVLHARVGITCTWCHLHVWLLHVRGATCTCVYYVHVVSHARVVITYTWCHMHVW